MTNETKIKDNLTVKDLWEIEMPVADLRPGKIETVESLHDRVRHAREMSFSNYR